MVLCATHQAAAKGEARTTPFGFLALHDRKPGILPNVRSEIRDLLAQRGKG